MFFMIGVNNGQRQLDFSQTITCSVCGRFGRYEVFMTYSVLTLFFITCFKWNRHYYVRTTCCGSVYELNPDVGRRIARGENIEIRPRDLSPVSTGGGYNAGSFGGYGQSGNGYGTGYGGYGSANESVRRCGYCGYTTTEDFAYCPKCGRKL